MTTLYWPSSIQLRPSVRYSGGPMDNRGSFQPEIGEPVERPRTTANPELFEVAFEDLSVTDFAVFKAFFRDDLANGSNRFIWRDPLTDDPAWFRIVKNNPPYQMTAASGGDFVQLSMQVMRSAIDPWFASYVPGTSAAVPDLVLDFANQNFGVDK